MKLRPLDTAGEESQIHFAAIEDERFLGCVLLQRREDGNYKIRQVVTAPDSRRRGIATRLVQTAEVWAREQGIPTLIAHVREVARQFWRAQGFVETGEHFEEVGLPHVLMIKNIQDEEKKPK